MDNARFYHYEGFTENILKKRDVVLPLTPYILPN